MSDLDIVFKAGSLAGLFSLIYLISDNIRKRPRLKFEALGRFGETYAQGSLECYRWTFDGLLKNVGPEATTVTRVWLVVWSNKARNSVRRYGFGGIEIRDKQSGDRIGPPLPLAARDSRHVIITCEFPLTGSDEARLVTETHQLPGHPNIQLLAHDYQLCFEDVAGNLFDYHGHLHNRREIELRWTLPNASQALQDGRLGPLTKQWLAIFVTRVSFRSKMILRVLGLWR